MDQQEQVAEILRGYARANEFQEKERMRRLAQMSTEESWAIFVSLMEHGHKTSSVEVLPERLLAWRLETKLAVRRTLKRLAEKQGAITKKE